MTLAEIAVGYQESAALVRERIRQLRELSHGEMDPEETQRLERRIRTLMVIWRETRQMAAWAAGYYETRPAGRGKSEAKRS